MFGTSSLCYVSNMVHSANGELSVNCSPCKPYQAMSPGYCSSFPSVYTYVTVTILTFILNTNQCCKFGMYGGGLHNL